MWPVDLNMDNSKDRENITKEIVKTSDSIRKKYSTLKTGKIEKDIALERHFKPIIDSLKQIVENTVEFSKDLVMTETFFSGENEEPKPKRKWPSALYDNLVHASTPVKSMLSQSKTVPSTLNEVSEIIQPRDLSYDRAPPVKEIFEVADEPLVYSTPASNIREARKAACKYYGPLRQKYLKAVPNGKPST